MWRREVRKNILAQVCEKTVMRVNVCVCSRLRLVRLWWCVLRKLLRVGQARWTDVCLGGTKNPGGKIFFVSVYIFDGGVVIFLSV